MVERHDRLAASSVLLLALAQSFDHLVEGRFLPLG
jgi:hypothetical protein